MKLLHTSDWHLGARLGRHDRQPDHVVALQGLLEVAESERPDLILHTGDLFDASRPPYPSLGLGITALQKLSALAPTVVLCGNHDSPALFRVLDQLAGATGPRRLRFLTQPELLEFPDIESVRVAVVCVPFIPPSAIADFASDDMEKFQGVYADGVRVINDRLLGKASLCVGEQGFVLYAAHLHVDGAKPGKSERRITVGEDYATHVQGLQRALYCAFGHIHDPQLLPGGIATGRYAGSLIQLDFGESEQVKQAVIVTVEDDVDVKSCKLPSGRPLTQFKGSLCEFDQRAENGGFDGCILKARVESDDPVLDLADRLAQRSPDCAVFELANAVANTKVGQIGDPQPSEQEEPSEIDLFKEWRETAAPATATKAPAERVLALFKEALDSVRAESRSDLGTKEMGRRADEILKSLASRRQGVS